MKIPVMTGTIARRLLVNYRADPDVVQLHLPHPFRPKLHGDSAIVGICLIHLENMRPTALPLPCGFSSQNAAHRIAVLWDNAEGESQEGVYIPRRDTGSLLNYLAGGRIFPAEHHLATFQVQTTDRTIDFHMRSHDNSVEVRVAGTMAETLPASSCFRSLAEASAFFEGGALGYSARCGSACLDGLRLKTRHWYVQTLDVTDVYSSFYNDKSQFPQGSICYDHTLLMQNIEHEWHAAPEMASHKRTIPSKVA